MLLVDSRIDLQEICVSPAKGVVRLLVEEVVTEIDGNFVSSYYCSGVGGGSEHCCLDMLYMRPEGIYDSLRVLARQRAHCVVH